MNLQQLNKINNCYQEAYNSYNEVKDYYFTFHFKISETLNKKTYSAKEIITIMKEINFNIQNYQNNINQIQHYLKYKCHPLDVTLKCAELNPAIPFVVAPSVEPAVATPMLF